MAPFLWTGVYGGPGIDVVVSFGGDDIVDVAGGDEGDTVDCHAGTDTVHVDATINLTTGQVRGLDTHINCETVNRVFPSL